MGFFVGSLLGSLVGCNEGFFVGLSVVGAKVSSGLVGLAVVGAAVDFIIE